MTNEEKIIMSNGLTDVCGILNESFLGKDLVKIFANTDEIKPIEFKPMSEKQKLILTNMSGNGITPDHLIRIAASTNKSIEEGYPIEVRDEENDLLLGHINRVWIEDGNLVGEMETITP